MPALRELCARRHVRRLALFGSATGERFDPTASDLDFLVEFEALPPTVHADCYFGLLDDLRRLFRLPIDLVEAEPIRNPYVRREIAATQEVLYAAA